MGTKTTLFFYPIVKDQDDLDSIIARCGWYFGPYAHLGFSIDIGCTPEMLANTRLPDVIEESIAPHQQKILQFVEPRGHECDETALLNGLDPAKHVLFLWSLDPKHKSRALTSATARLRAAGRYYEIDRNKSRMEGSQYLWSGLNVFADKASALAQSQLRFRQLKQAVGNVERAYVFGTGPSLSAYCEQHDFSDGVSIVANSIVKNDYLLDKLAPKVITAGDPIFHAGCSRYAGEFRRNLVRALRRTGAWFVTPLRDYYVYQSFLPSDLQDRLIGIPFDRNPTYPVDLDRSFHVFPYPNILTLLMLPVASSLAREIATIGFDGRPISESNYFWQHDKNAQFNDEMENIKKVHPGFFAIDYNDYYLEHCDQVKFALESLEHHGKRVVSLSSSFIPALSERHSPSVQAAPNGTAAAVAAAPPRAAHPLIEALVSIDPDGENNFGHFLSYDNKIADNAAEVGLRSHLIGRASLDESCLGKALANPIKVFTVNSWTVANKEAPKPEDLRKFAAELEDGLKQLPPCSGKKHYVLYVYTGGIEIAEIIDRIIANKPQFRANVNLFWAVNHDEAAPAYVRRWRDVVRRLAVSRKITLTVPTEQLAKDFEAAFGVVLPVAHHPSTTFSDAEARALETLPDPGEVTEVLFPGGMREDKGFLLTADAAPTLAREPGLRVTMRALRPKVMPQKVLRAFARIENTPVVLNDEELDDNEFQKFLAKGHIIVCPYLSPYFARRTSGLVVDAMLLGRPMVAVKGTWLGEFATQSGAGLACEPTAAGIVNAVKHVAANYAKFARRAKETRFEYLANNSWAALVDAILAEAKPAVLKPLPAPARTPEPAGASAAVDVASRPVPVSAQVASPGLRQASPAPIAKSTPAAGAAETARPHAAELSAAKSPPRPLGGANGASKPSGASPTAAKPAAPAQPPRQASKPPVAQPVSARPTVQKPRPMPKPVAPRQPLYTRFALWAESNSPMVFGLGQFAMWMLRTARRYIGPTLLALAVTAALVYAIFVPGLEEWRAMLLGVLAVLAGGALLTISIGYARHLIKKARTEYSITADQRVARIVSDVVSEARKQAQAVQDARQKTDQRLSDVEKGLRQQLDQRAKSLDQHVAKVETAGTAFQKRLDTINSEVAAQKQQLAKLAADIARVAKVRDDVAGQKTLLAGVSSNIASLFKVADQVALQQTALSKATDEAERQKAQLSKVAEALPGIAKNAAEINAQREQIAKVLKDLAVLSKLAGEVAQQKTDLTKVSAAVPEIAKIRGDVANLQRLSAAMDKLQQQASAIEASVASVVTARDEISGRVTDVTKRVDKIGHQMSRTAVVNAARFQAFNRQLSDEHVEKLKLWSKKLDLGLSAQAIAFLAHRIGLIEMRTHGRLATSIEDVTLRSMVAVAAKGNPREILEIGTLFGIGAIALHEATLFDSRGIHLTLLDPLDGYYSANNADVLTGRPVNETVLRTNLEIMGVEKSEVSIVKGFSTNPSIAETVGKKRYDMLVIDGDHSYEGVKNDFEVYSKYVNMGGLVIFDDYNSKDWPEVTRYVDEVARKRGDVEFLGAEWRTAVFRMAQPLS